MCYVNAHLFIFCSLILDWNWPFLTNFFLKLVFRTFRLFLLDNLKIKSEKYNSSITPFSASLFLFLYCSNPNFSLTPNMPLFLACDSLFELQRPFNYDRLVILITPSHTVLLTHMFSLSLFSWSLQFFHRKSNSSGQTYLIFSSFNYRCRFLGSNSDVPISRYKSPIWVYRFLLIFSNWSKFSDFTTFLSVFFHWPRKYLVFSFRIISLARMIQYFLYHSGLFVAFMLTRFILLFFSNTYTYARTFVARTHCLYI